MLKNLGIREKIKFCHSFKSELEELKRGGEGDGVDGKEAGGRRNITVL